MQANTNTPSEIFGSNVQYVVPIFQRPYVWNRVDQWEPFWEDVRALTEKVINNPSPAFGVPPVAPHFLGAVVIDQQLSPSGFIAIRHVVDGQQRLTTLQLLIDAALEIVEAHGDSEDAHGLRVLALNDGNLAKKHPDRIFKVWPTRRDQDAFRASMTDNLAVPAPLADSAIAQAHKFFRDRIAEWSETESTDAHSTEDLLHALVFAIRENLKIVVIDLEPGDNAQVIFETLNHRGSPLLAADLVKNLVFQLALTQSQDVDKLYDQHWKQFDAQEWRKPQAQGRLFRPRIDVFLNHWLVMNLQREVPSDRVFAEFRDGILRDPDISIDTLLGSLARDATVFDRMESFAPESVEGRFYYRVVRALDTATVTPVLLWLLRWSESDLSIKERHRALRALESWLVRRSLAKLTSKNINLLMLELLRHLASGGPSEAGRQTEEFLAGQTADSRFWPDDSTVRTALRSQSIYTGLLRARLRMVLEAIEDDYRSALGEGQSCAKNLTVEHIMPRAWREHWHLKDDRLERAISRDAIIHRLGNLTLVSSKLNPTLSNRPWTAEQAVKLGLKPFGKRQYLLDHSNLSLNAKIVATHEAAWTEDDIRDRTESMIDSILSIWPRPQSAVATDVQPTYEDGEIDNSEDSIDESVDPQSTFDGKYHALWAWLTNQDQDEITLSFVQIEQIIDMPLPPSARNHKAHWTSVAGSALCRSIREADWKATNIDLLQESVTLVRILAELENALE
ncbi:MAG: DUF262 domain-containing protein [Rhodococcus sp. (in: high G+C Gram-positive bacteria)]|nr:DUF262 domain-containing protein [Rhodococcus sp. (in: high G+C Gram-positive bacteria)]MDI6627151.1 DUF262 domain-containing protein [Rhodococcus sp. (in: high G+C Gram-positive bacteria)]